MTRLGANTSLGKTIRPDANYLPDEWRSPSLKTRKGSRDAWGPGGRRSISVALSGNGKGSASRPGAGKKYWKTGLETTAVDIDNLRDLTILLS